MSTTSFLELDNFIIHLSDAQNRISLWQQDQCTLITAMEGTPAHVYEGMPMLHVKAFTFKFEEMAELVGKINHHNGLDGATRISGVRFYLGVKAEGNEAASPKPCLVAVGVSDFNPNGSMGGDDVISIVSTENPSLIYDFSYPCPSTCGNAGYTIMDYTESNISGN